MVRSGGGFFEDKVPTSVGVMGTISFCSIEDESDMKKFTFKQPGTLLRLQKKCFF